MSSTPLRLPEKVVLLSPAVGASHKRHTQSQASCWGLGKECRAGTLWEMLRKHRRESVSVPPLFPPSLSRGQMCLAAKARVSLGNAAVRFRAEHGKGGRGWEADRVGQHLVCSLRLLMPPLVNVSLPSMNRAVRLSHLFQDKDFFKNVRELQTVQKNCI